LAVVLGLGLLLLSFVRIAGDANSNALSGKVLDSVLERPLWNTALGWNLALFVAALIALHVVFALLCWGLAALSQYAFPAAAASRSKLLVLWCMAGWIWVFVANAKLFPHTSLGEPYAELVRAHWAGIDVFEAFTVVMLSALTGTLAVAMIRYVRSRRPSAVYFALGVVGSGAIVAAASFDAPPSAAPSKPHVIIIGIDSLRPDVFSPAKQPSVAPNLQHHLAQSVRFGDTTTPLARTFPAWVSIITGRHPHTTGALINLLPRDLIHPGDTLPDLFGRAGYRTIYAIDEARFSNLDASYGFDQTITPPMGASEFLIGFFGDTPVSNLVVNTRLGELLFPHLHANRGVAATYDPNAFIRKLDRNLRFDAPTLLAVHLTLAHWPFSWADSPAPADRFGADSDSYPSAVGRVDQQFHDLMALLEQHGALTNAVVVVLSDHGEALGQTEDLLVDEGAESFKERELLTQKWGHGTSVLSPHQYRTVLAMRAYGNFEEQFPSARNIGAPASLEDIAPTLAELFALDVRQPFDGRSLAPLLRAEPGAEASFQERIRFTESEFSPREWNPGSITRRGVELAALFYHVHPSTDRLEFRRERVAEALMNRQYAAIGPSHLLAAVPSTAETGFDLFAARIGASTSRKLAGEPEEGGELAALRAALQNRFGLTLTALPAAAEH